MTDQVLLNRNLIERVCVGDIVTRSADLYPERPAIIDGQRQLNYRELNDQANRLGHALIGLGLKNQDVVAVMARNSLEFLVSYFACAKAGLICSPVNLALRSEEVGYCLRDSKARVLIVESVLAPGLTGLPEQLPDLRHIFVTGDERPSLTKLTGTFDDLLEQGSTAELEVLIQDRDPVQLIYTSGTTGHPKGVLTSHLAVTFAAMSNALATRMVPGMKLLGTLPLFHCAALNSNAVPILLGGGTLILVKTFDPVETVDLIEKYEINMVVLLPMMYGHLLGLPGMKDRTFPSVTNAVYGMAPMPEERLQAIHDLFPNADVYLGSGQTEFTPCTCVQRPEHQWTKASSWGTATPVTRVAIMDDHGKLLPRGEVGEIVYRGPQVMNEYLNRPEETEASFKHGWFHSGDVAWMDEDGAIWFTDRKKDVIKTGGENVASIEVERGLMGHPAVAEAAVVGVAHPRWGEAVTAAVILKPDAEVDEESLLAYSKNVLSGFQIPKKILFVDEFPRTGTGKIQKNVIRKQLENSYSEGAETDS